MSGIDTGAIRHWLFDKALPFWAVHGYDRVHGGPVEEVGLDGGVSDPGHKRVRVFCRQVYVYSHAYALGWQPGLGHARQLYHDMIKHCWQGPDTGFAKRVGSDNRIIDPTLDLYDNAFALYGMGWYYKVAKDDQVLTMIEQLARLIDTALRHPKIGFWHQLPPVGDRLQNPHMHLLEACLACFEATGLPIFERLAREVIDLFTGHFYDPTRATLCEYFDDDLNRLPGPRGQIVEPGHQFEWAWILARAKALFGVRIETCARGLIDFGERFGVDPVTHATYNSIDETGAILDGGSRTWPNTERIKAAIAGFELFGDDPRPVLQDTLDVMFKRYLSHAPEGGWVDAFDRDGRAVATAMPTSTFYHVFLAFAEVLRVEDAVAQRFRD